MFLLAGADVTKKHPRLGQSALEIAQSVHELWGATATASLVKLLTVAASEPQYALKMYAIEKEAGLMLAELDAQKLARTKRQTFVKMNSNGA